MTKTHVYEVEDDDILMLFFGEDAPMRRNLAEVGKDHGKLIFDGMMSLPPEQDDILVLDGANGGRDEYMVIQRFFHADTDSVTLVVHTPHYEEGVQS